MVDYMWLIVGLLMGFGTGTLVTSFVWAVSEEKDEEECFEGEEF